jgi:hypothetical protein
MGKKETRKREKGQRINKKGKWKWENGNMKKWKGKWKYKKGKGKCTKEMERKKVWYLVLVIGIQWSVIADW